MSVMYSGVCGVCGGGGTDERAEFHEPSGLGGGVVFLKMTL